MVQECTSSYNVKERTDGSLTITIDVPRRFAPLWLVKLSELKASSHELDSLD
jgi:hypothetical protein